jgi:hypothetical protein
MEFVEEVDVGRSECDVRVEGVWNLCALRSSSSKARVTKFDC